MGSILRDWGIVYRYFQSQSFDEIQHKQAKNNNAYTPDDFEYDIERKYAGVALNVVKNAIKIVHNVTSQEI